MESNENWQLSKQLVTRLLNEMRSGSFKNSDRLPSEEKLAVQLGVSRTALRDALGSLEREGYVSRRRGLGTLINRHVLDSTSRIDLFHEFMDLVREEGYTPRSEILLVDRRPAARHEQDALHIGPADMVLQVTRRIFADDIPALICTDTVPLSYIIKKDYEKAACSEIPFFDFLEEYCDIRTYMDISHISAIAADDAVAARLAIPENSAVLKFEEQYYDFDGRPVLLAEEWYRHGIIHHTLLRKRM